MNHRSIRHLAIALLISMGITAPAAFAGGPALHPTEDSLSFSSINANGNMALRIKQVPLQEADTIGINNNGPQWVQAKVKHGVLYLTEKASQKKEPKAIVTIDTHRLFTLTLAGNASATSKNLHVKHLVINVNDNSDIKLAGMIGIDAINQHGNSRVNVRWVDSKQLTIDSDGNGKITLAGVVNTMHARLNDHARLNAQYLRAQHVLVKTQDNATAKVLSRKSLRAFASNQSDIYYYKTPAHITRVSTQSGNILQLDWRS